MPDTSAGECKVVELASAVRWAWRTVGDPPAACHLSENNLLRIANYALSL